VGGGDPAAPPESPEAPRPDATADLQILDDIGASIHGDRFRRLLRGDLSDYNGDHSAAGCGSVRGRSAGAGKRPPTRWPTLCPR